MNLRRFSATAVCLTALCAWQSAHGASITHTNLPDFQGGISDGVVQAMQETSSGTPASGGVGVLPGQGTSIINDDFNYTTVAAASDKYLFLTPNTADHPELATNPSQFLFSGDAATAPSASAPAAGALRIHSSRPQDFYNTNLVGQRSPLLVINKQVITGDFVAETKFTIQQPRSANQNRKDGLFISLPAVDGTGAATDVPLDDTTRYVFAGTARVGTTDSLVTDARLYPSANANGGFPSDYVTGSFPGQTWYVRIVKRGAYFYSYMKNAETAPWVFQQWVKVPDLANQGLVVGVGSVSYDVVNATSSQYQDDDFDYLHVNQVGALSGSFTNVFDAGTASNWQTVSLNTNDKQGLKYQLRTGNTFSAGTLTDAGSFQGPDGTAASFYTDDAAQVVANAEGKRYLEYKIFLDAATSPGPNDAVSPQNLPAFLRSITANYQPAALSSKILSTTADFGADAGGIQTQPGGGDLSLARSTVFQDDFTASTLDPGWTFDPGYTAIDPTAVGDYSLTERPGYFRMKVGYPQDFYIGTGSIKKGGVKLLRDLPAGLDQNNFEIETEINVENQQCRGAEIVLFQDVNNFMGLGASRRFENNYDIGVLEDTVLNNAGPDPVIRNYGSNVLQLRVTKQGTMVTLSLRDPNSASPSWRVLVSRDTKGLATGGTDFLPTKVGLLGKSYALADEGTVNYDYNYFRISNLTATGQKDMALTLPANSHPDAVLAFGDGLTALNSRAQVQTSGGTFVGPDGTSSTYFTVNEPKIPASLDGITTSAVRVLMAAAPASGVPYLHATGIEYTTGTNRVARDTNATDFAAGTLLNGVNTTTTPGVVIPTISTGAAQTTDFNSAPANFLLSNTAPDPALNNPANPSTVDYTAMPGFAQLNVSRPVDLWAPGTGTQKPRTFLYNSATVTGDFELETYVSFPAGRSPNRHQGLGVVQAQAGATPDAKLDLSNVILFGPYQTDQIRMMRGDANNFADFGLPGYTDNAYYLRLRKVGQLFTGSVSTDGVTYTDVASYTFSHTMPTMYVGLLAKSYAAGNDIEVQDYDYFKLSPLSTTGIFESRVLDLGTAGVTPSLSSLGGNSAAVQLQFRAADTASALAALPYVGPDGTNATSYSGTFNGTLTGLTGRYVQYRATLPAGTQLNDVGLVGVSASSVPLSRTDVIQALRIAGGLQAATASDIARLDVVKGSSANKIELLDAAQILRTVNGF